ncbi:helix-turn-helix domain-containing protein [Sneathiella chungangensis]|uniref:Helix-turn-helix domain-containing protein n=1 Tax=Sneathiella chungangensis TaxID=1418234 RepID=A0A845MJ80_9PROT|nr:IclR family transcriptional regulator [Sneathiella chungangensis]MZR23889.1 helix-turn-helix domain-containing protein [Sneathiella chungangensis]
MVKSADRIIDILEMLVASERPLTQTEIASQVKIPKSSAFALLATLEKRAYVIRSKVGYELNLQSPIQFRIVDERVTLRQIAKPILDQVTATTRESTFIGVLTKGYEVRYLDKSVSEQEIRYDADVTKLRPAYCTSTGQVLLAGLSDSEFELYLKTVPREMNTENTLVSEDRLRQRILDVRQYGYAKNINERVVGASGIAVPIKNQKGSTVASICVSAPTQRFEKIEGELESAIIDGGARLSDTYARLQHIIHNEK